MKYRVVFLGRLKGELGVRYTNIAIVEIPYTAFGGREAARQACSAKYEHIEFISVEDA